VANYPYSTEEAWRELRARHIGASESPALFGISPFITPWQLWHVKVGNLPPADLENNTAVLQGQHFEPAIAAYAASKFGIQLRKVRRYITDDTTDGMGCSLDFEQFGTGSLIPTEIKWSVQWGAWDWDGDDITAAPDHYLVQCHHQIACTGADRANLFAFVGGDLKRLTVERNDTIIDSIRWAVKQFWASVRSGHEPEPDYVGDGEAIAALSMIRPVAALDGDEEVQRLARRRLRAARMIKKLEDISKEARARIDMKMMAAAKERGVQPGQTVVCAAGPYRITSTPVAASQGKIVTPDMVGTYIGARAGYRMMRVTEPKQKEKK